MPNRRPYPTDVPDEGWAFARRRGGRGRVGVVRAPLNFPFPLPNLLISPEVRILCGRYDFAILPVYGGRGGRPKSSWLLASFRRARVRSVGLGS
jgi:hypothetical protein